MITSIGELAAVMQADGVRLQADVARGRLEATNVIAGQSASLVVIWDTTRTTLQVVQLLPWPVPADRLSDAAVAMARANHELFLPAFGLNAATGAAYCRGALPLPAQGLEASLIRALISAVTRIAREHGPTVSTAWRAAA